ncbi:hypothetical protein GJAV_G00113100 [Gymnothorax javanicus]|nr:hypothetical protein GJAV_G00113100 [Gymnothorax javanicus]
MDISINRLKADAGNFLSRAVQFTEEVLGHAEKTELDVHLETLLARSEFTKLWTERILSQTEVLLQPNPSVRIEEFFYEKLEKKAPLRPNNHELLGMCMNDSGHELGPGTVYGSALIKCGETERQIGGAEREFIQGSVINFLAPFKNFIEGDFPAISRERRLLQNKRLDLDVAKSKLKKARVAETRSAQLNSTPPLGEEYGAHFSYMLSFLHVKWLKAERELMVAQSQFDQQAEITRLLLEGISTTHAHHLRCLNEFVDAQATYYERCYQYMIDLQKQLGSNNLPSSPSSTSMPTTSPSMSPVGPSVMSELPISGTSRKARVLYDRDAASSGELSLVANEIIMVSSAPGMDFDWLVGERGDHKGKVPKSCLELLS